MNWRRTELEHFGDQIAWLDTAEATRAYDLSIPCVSNLHFGLNTAVVTDIERIDVDKPDSNANVWLSKRIGNGSVLIVYSRTDVCRVQGQFFAENWQDILCPSRDDAVIVSELGRGVLFYCHEDEFEFGERETV